MASVDVDEEQLEAIKSLVTRSKRAWQIMVVINVLLLVLTVISLGFFSAEVNQVYQKSVPYRFLTIDNNIQTTAKSVSAYADSLMAEDADMALRDTLAEASLMFSALANKEESFQRVIALYLDQADAFHANDEFPSEWLELHEQEFVDLLLRSANRQVIFAESAEIISRDVRIRPAD